MSRMTLLAGVAIGVVAAVVLGRDRLTQAHSKAKDVWESPKVQDTVAKADRFIAQKAPTLHGVGEAVVDSMPRKKGAASSMPSTSAVGSGIA